MTTEMVRSTHRICGRWAAVVQRLCFGFLSLEGEGQRRSPTVISGVPMSKETEDELIDSG